MTFEIKSPFRSMRPGVLFSLFTRMMPSDPPGGWVSLAPRTELQELRVPDSIAHS